MANNINLRHLRAFVAVADKGSFVAASETLHLSQPALSQIIRHLEEEIGDRLFVRTTRRVHLSTLGMSLLPQARHLIRQFDATIGDLKDVAARRRGRVMVACLPSVTYRLMPRVVATSKRLHPGMNVIVHDSNLKGVIDAVKSGAADLGIGSLPPAEAELESIAVARDQMQAVFPRDHPLAELEEVRWTDLQRYPFVAMTYETGIRKLVDEAVETSNVTLDIVAEVSNLSTVNGMLEEGIGISALPGLAAPADNHPLLIHRPLVKPVVERRIMVFWRAVVGLSPGASALLNALRTTVAEESAQAWFPAIRWLFDEDRPER
jgi:LysR family carnitine catabolism transcriptional activator